MHTDILGRHAKVWHRMRSAATYIKTLLKGDRYEWRIDLTKAARPVLLIHGFAAPRHCMTILEERLTADGYDVFSFKLGPANLLSVEEAARIIAIKLTQLKRLYGLVDIAIIGHSLGGIIGRALICLRHGDRLCHTLITLGSPHQGHPAWRWSRFTPMRLFTKVPRDLSPDSPLMQRLKAIPIPPTIYAVSLFSDYDRVCPANLCSLDIPSDTHHLVNLRLSDISHLGFMFDEHVYEILRTQLAEGFRRWQTRTSDPDETLPPTHHLHDQA